MDSNEFRGSSETLVRDEDRLGLTGEAILKGTGGGLAGLGQTRAFLTAKAKNRQVLRLPVTADEIERRLTQDHRLGMVLRDGASQVQHSRIFPDDVKRRDAHVHWTSGIRRNGAAEFK